MPRTPSNSFAADSKGVNPEDYHQVILNTSPKSTVLFTDLGEGDDIKNIEYSWSTEQLATPETSAIVEGATATCADMPLPTRLKNFTQIMEKGYNVTTTEEAVAKKGGTGTDIKKRMLLRALDMKRGANKSLFTNATAIEHAEGVAGLLGGLPYWFDAANAQFNNPNVIAAGSKKITESLLLQAMQTVYDVHEFEKLNGYCSSAMKLQIDNFTGGAVVNKTKSEKKAGNIIDVYETSCGDIQIKIDRQAPNTDFYGLDTRYWKKGFLQEFENRTKSGDGDNKPAHKIEKYVTWEMGMFAKNPLAGFRISGLVVA
ncbi:hypothetical protein SPSIL_015150 [Sporomusa silvacetica DSM 10669]|uniref:Phage capsid family protein n=1 Tax=Sporomusa silvacetica DSM 10669 TaxID=1123289 RepID=A0ABZ3IIC6_9FIRM|nr:DUF5309 family protein [Sporomusa silvacetica]OZC21577.1 hypothetical protein SPSIL_09880 [Sporomusa silvacetica DSM 10669]